MKNILYLLSLSLFLTIGGTSTNLKAQEDSIQFINDFAKLLDEPEVAFLEETLENFHQKTGIKIYFGTIKAIGKKDFSEYTTSLYQKLPISTEAKQKTVLVLVARKEMQGNIYAGDSLNPYLTENIKEKMMRILLVEAFKKGEYALSFQRTFVSLSQLFTNKITPEELEVRLEEEQVPSPGFFFYMQFVMFISLFVAVGFVMFKSFFQKRPKSD